MGSSLLDTGDRCLQVVQGTSATRTRDIFRLTDTGSCSLQDSEHTAIRDNRLASLIVQHQAIPETIQQKRSEIGGGFQLQQLHIRLPEITMQDNRHVTTRHQQFMHSRTLRANPIPMMCT